MAQAGPTAADPPARLVGVPVLDILEDTGVGLLLVAGELVPVGDVGGIRPGMCLWIWAIRQVTAKRPFRCSSSMPYATATGSQHGSASPGGTRYPGHDGDSATGYSSGHDDHILTDSGTVLASTSASSAPAKLRDRLDEWDNAGRPGLADLSATTANGEDSLLARLTLPAC